MQHGTHLRVPALLICLILLFAVCAHAVTYTEDGGMIVGGDGNDDFSVVDGTNSSYSEQTIVTPPPESPQEKGPGPTFVKSEKMDFYFMLEDGSMECAEMISAGTVHSLVELNGEKTYVDTCRLMYEIDEVPDERRYAMINAQKSGYATLFNRASSKSDVVGRFMTNRICLVLDVGEKFTRIWVDDSVGYIATSSLIFLEGRGENLVTAQVSYNGKTKSGNRINIHMNGKNKSRILEDLPCGTHMTVFSTTEDGWTEIEANGWHAWILSEYVTYDSEETASE